MSSWVGKIFGGAVGFALGGPLGAVIGTGLGAGLDEAVDAEPADSLSIEGKYSDDEIGRLISIKISSDTPAECHAVVHFVDNSSNYLKGRGYYTDSDGDFSLVTPVAQGQVSFFLPFGAVILPKADTYRMRISVVVHNANATSPLMAGRAHIAMKLPFRDDFDMVAVLRPLIELAMLVVRSDSVVKPEEIRLLKEFFTESFELSHSDMVKLRDQMKSASRSSVESLVEQCLQRIPSINSGNLIAFLARVAHCDGDVDPQEVSLIRRIALAIGVDHSEVEEILENLELRAVDHFETLGVRQGASRQEVVSAYRRLVSMYHPDKVAGMASEFQDLANRKFIEIRAAYESIIKHYPRV